MASFPLSWSSIQTIVIFLGPMALPRIIAFYNSIRTSSAARPVDLTPKTRHALGVLQSSAVAWLFLSLPFFHPPNVFTKTSSRLQTPTDVLFTRLAALGPLSPQDKRIRTLFQVGGLEARLLYLRFGPDVLGDCPLVTDPKATSAALAYMVYALPMLAAPHIAHLFCIGMATDATLSGPHAARWRAPAMVVGAAMLALDLAVVWGFDHGANAAATRLGDLNMFYWRMMLVRFLSIVVVDAVLGWVIWLGATGRAFPLPKSGAERAEEATKAVERLYGKLKGLGAVRNVVHRDAAMRGAVERYWVRDEQLMGRLFEDRDVVQAMNDALEKSDMPTLQRDADAFVSAVLPADI